MVSSSSRIYCTEDARCLAKRRLPKLVFDFVDGATGREIGVKRNFQRFDDICLQSRVMGDVSTCDLTTNILGKSFDVPFGIAPMGMCNLIHPHADRYLAEMAQNRGLPVCVSSAASTELGEMQELSGGNAWFQLYFGQSEEVTLKAVQRAKGAGYDTLILTADVPKVSRRVRDLRNGFNVPFRLTSRTFLDFALHPAWSISTLINGAPSPKNLSVETADIPFDRNASRAGADWNFLCRLRDEWQGKLIVKGVTSPQDAVQIQNIGVDALYVSNHGARQLDSSPAAIDLLSPIREAVKPDMPLIFDSGVRSGEDVAKALALGADFVMLGRPLLFALGAEGKTGLDALINSIVHDLGVVMAQLGASSVDQLGANCIHSSHEADENTSGATLVTGPRIVAGKLN